jgi:hypothetical protein
MNPMGGLIPAGGETSGQYNLWAKSDGVIQTPKTTAARID